MPEWMTYMMVMLTFGLVMVSHERLKKIERKLDELAASSKPKDPRDA